MRTIPLLPIRRNIWKETAMSNHLVRNLILGALASALLIPGAPALGATLDRIRDSGTVRLGYLADARPFSFKGETGEPEGYGVALCGAILDEIRTIEGMQSIEASWVEVPAADSSSVITSGQVDLLCTAAGETLARRAELSFSLPILPGGTGVVLRNDAPAALREILSRDRPAERPIWRGMPARTVLGERIFAAVEGTLSADWLAERAKTLQLSSTILPVPTHEAGVQAVVDRSADAFFGQMPVLLDAAKRNAASGSLLVLPRLFTHETLALPMARDDDDFRLVVDRGLSRAFRNPKFPELFGEWFGEPDETMVTFFQQIALPD